LDKKILEACFQKPIQLINDENFIINGKITAIYENSVAFFSNGKIRYLDFNRIKEIRPLGENHDR